EIVIGLEIGRDLRRARNGRLSRYGLCRPQTNQGGCGDRYRMEAALLAHGRLLFNEGATLISVEIVPDLTMEGSPYVRERTCVTTNDSRSEGRSADNASKITPAHSEGFPQDAWRAGAPYRRSERGTTFRPRQ